ncbi:hypothetical protein LY78DRAFT_97935 [Colletotrichum sublineola]|nr:hypothetical protein LY78DRAFT_97935 [Colletotrichum sublineola]
MSERDGRGKKNECALLVGTGINQLSVWVCVGFFFFCDCSNLVAGAGGRERSVANRRRRASKWRWFFFFSSSFAVDAREGGILSGLLGASDNANRKWQKKKEKMTHNCCC